MKKGLVLIAMIAISLITKSQTANHSNNEVVINKLMIEHFNSIEYSEDQVDITYILSNYSFDEAKDVIMAYRSGEIETTTAQSIDTYLSEKTNKNKESEISLPKNAENQLLATQQ